MPPTTLGSNIWDAFLAHASEDKESVCDRLVADLQRLGITVWYDTFELKVGDSISAKIDQGLINSRYGIVVLSPSFFSKNWPKTELHSLISQEQSEGRTIILPVWHEIDESGIREKSTILADRLALRTADGIDKVVAGLGDQIREGGAPSRGLLRKLQEHRGVLRVDTYADIREDLVELLADRFDHRPGQLEMHYILERLSEFGEYIYLKQIVNWVDEHGAAANEAYRMLLGADPDPAVLMLLCCAIGGNLEVPSYLGNLLFTIREEQELKYLADNGSDYLSLGSFSRFGDAYLRLADKELVTRGPGGSNTRFWLSDQGLQYVRGRFDLEPVRRGWPVPGIPGGWEGETEAEWRARNLRASGGQSTN